MNLNRREFVCAAATGVAAMLPVGTALAEAPAPDHTADQQVPSPSKLPRWRGFNLLEKFDARWGRPYQEQDFALVAEWGFNFVRLPMSYLCWTDASNWFALREPALRDIDQAVEFGRQHGIHVNLNLHRAPGYCVNPPKEPADLWTEESALNACAYHWAHLAQRYKGVSSSRLSFDLLNEPADIKADQYAYVVRRLVEAIRAEDPKRLIIADGLKWGNVPVPELADLHIAQSTRGYSPSRVSHYQASWVDGAEKWPAPTWPLEFQVKQKDGTETREVWDRQRLQRQQIDPWKQLEASGVGVHVGEWGAHNRTPHDVVLAWMRDNLELWKQAGWGWALWNLAGSFGVLDSGRTDVQYESWRGRGLDRQMLDLLRES